MVRLRLVPARAIAVTSNAFPDDRDDKQRLASDSASSHLCLGESPRCKLRPSVCGFCQIFEAHKTLDKALYAAHTIWRFVAVRSTSMRRLYGKVLLPTLLHASVMASDTHRTELSNYTGSSG